MFCKINLMQKPRTYIIAFLLLFMLPSCVMAQLQGKYLIVDTLTMRGDTADYHFTTYTPKDGAEFAFVRTRPDSLDERIGLSIVAAFTSRAPEHIVGANVCQGVLSKDSTENETGCCIILKGRVEMLPLEGNQEKSISRAVSGKGDYFQQKLLVYNRQAVPTTVFRNRTTARRALVQTENSTFVVETLDRIHIDDFTQCLIRMDAISAIYLDMGSWSEGWYRTEDGALQMMGENYRSTHLQTNWLIVKPSKRTLPPRKRKPLTKD